MNMKRWLSVTLCLVSEHSPHLSLRFFFRLVELLSTSMEMELSIVSILSTITSVGVFSVFTCQVDKVLSRTIAALKVRPQRNAKSIFSPTWFLFSRTTFCLVCIMCLHKKTCSNLGPTVKRCTLHAHWPL